MPHMANGYKQCFYFPREMLEEMRAEARRLGRSFPWVARKSVEIGLPKIAAFDPGAREEAKR